jgi:hypothetical protein
MGAVDKGGEGSAVMPKYNRVVAASGVIKEGIVVFQVELNAGKAAANASA